MAGASNFFENLILSLLGAAENTVPIFIHSKNGMAVLNATEPIVNTFIGSLLAQQQVTTPAPTPAPVAPMPTPAAAPSIKPVATSAS